MDLRESLILLTTQVVLNSTHCFGLVCLLGIRWLWWMWPEGTYYFLWNLAFLIDTWYTGRDACGGSLLAFILQSIDGFVAFSWLEWAVNLWDWIPSTKYRRIAGQCLLTVSAIVPVKLHLILFMVVQYSLGQKLQKFWQCFCSLPFQVDCLK